MKKRFLMIATILCFSLTLNACSNANRNEQQSHTPGTAEDDEYTLQSKLDVLRPAAYGNVEGLSLEPGSYISIIGRYSDDSYWKELEAGAKKAVEDMNSMLKYKGDDKVKLSFIAPEICDDVDEQVSILDEELDRRPIAIGIAAVDASACSIQFDLAAENGIPIITFDSGSDYKHIASHISTNNIEAAETAACKLAYAIEEKGEVAVFVQDSLSMTAKDRLAGFTKTMKSKFPDISVAHVYHLDELKTMQQTIAAEKNAVFPESITQEEVVTYILEKHPNLKGIYTTNLDTTQLVADVLSKLERDNLKFVGFDGGEEQMELLKEDVLEGLIIQNPYGMGYATVVAATRISMGLGNESFVNCGYTWVTKDNMDTAKIKQMLY